MSKYPLLLIDNKNYTSMPRRESAGVDFTPRMSNEGSEYNFITLPGGPTLADSGVTLVRQAIACLTHKPSNQTQGRRLQFGKEGI